MLKQFMLAFRHRFKSQPQCWFTFITNTSRLSEDADVTRLCFKLLFKGPWACSMLSCHQIVHALQSGRDGKLKADSSEESSRRRIAAFMQRSGMVLLQAAPVSARDW
ncbi:hypothetical protein WJX82_010244 [Trebouxia sp. C0006]